MPFGFGGSRQQEAEPVATSSAAAATPDENTIDEPVWRTIWRDLVTIARNCRSVLIPIKWKFNNQEQALRNWDLWGPLIFMLMLATILSWGEKNQSDVFSLVFAECGIGAVVMTANVILLGGDIVFFQALCLLGYCLFPICVAAIICLNFTQIWVRVLALSLGLGWAAAATVPFMGQAVPERRKGLALYPVVLLYASIGWLALVKR